MARPHAGGKCRHHFGWRALRAPAGVGPGVGGDGDDIDRAARLNRIVRDVALAAEPQRDFRLAHRRWRHLRRHQRTPCDTLGKLQRCCAFDAVAHHRPDAVGADQADTLRIDSRLAAHGFHGDAVGMGCEGFDPRADFDHRDAGVIVEMWDDVIRHEHRSC